MTEELPGFYPADNNNSKLVLESQKIEMSDNKASEWTEENLKKLLAALKTNGGQHDKIQYSKALKKVDWQKVAFPPFSAEACRIKWTEILQTMQKTRTLKELIVEAENNLANSAQTPKRPSPPNVIFFEENWAEFRKQNPKMVSQKLLIRISNMYKELPDEEKARYVEKHQRASEEYHRLMVKLGKRRATNKKLRAKLKRKSVSTNSPNVDEGAEDDEGLPAKPPSTGYNLFCKEQLNSMADVSTSYVSAWAKRWRDLSENQRKEYSARCEELKSKYMTRLNEHIMTLSEEEQQRVLEEHGIKTHTSKRKGKRTFYGEPKMPPRSGNTIFFKEQMKVLKEEFPNSRKRFMEVSHRWLNLSSKEKLLYSQKLNESMKTYSVELQRWFKTLTPERQQEYVACNPKKSKYLYFTHEVDNRIEERHLHRTSDSEDEIIEESSSDEKEDDYVSVEDEDEEEDGDGDDTMFDMF